MLIRLIGRRVALLTAAAVAALLAIGAVAVMAATTSVTVTGNNLQCTQGATTAACASTLSVPDGQSVTIAASQPPVNTSVPTISGTAQQGQTLTISHYGTWTGSTSQTGIWQDCDTSGANCADIAGSAGANTYLLAASDVGHTVEMKETAAGPGGSASVSSAPTAVITSNAPAPPPPSSVDWTGSFTTSTCPDKATVFSGPGTKWIGSDVSCVADPLGSGQMVAKYTVPNADQTCCGTPRADLESPANISSGQTLYFSVPMYLGTAPLMSAGGAQQAETFGSPYSGSMTVGFTLIAHGGCNTIAFGNRSGSLYWYSPCVGNAWHDLIFEEYFTTASNGFLKVWWDGVAQTFTTGSQTFTEQTMVPGVTCNSACNNNFLDIDSYRAANNYSTLTTYHGEPAIGPTYDSVAGTLVNPPFGP